MLQDSNYMKSATSKLHLLGLEDSLSDSRKEENNSKIIALYHKVLLNSNPNFHLRILLHNSRHNNALSPWVVHSYIMH